jgi:hypothetical protein
MVRLWVMNRHSRALQDVVDHLRSCDEAYVRATAERTSGSEPEDLRYAEVFIGATPFGWFPEVWRYESNSFVAQRVSGAIAADLVAGQPVTIADVELGPSDVPAEVSTERHPSQVLYGLHQLTRPVVRTEIGMANRQRYGRDFDVLVGSSPSPSFVSYNDAFASFFRVQRMYGTYSAPADQIIVSEVDTRGWIERVELSPSLMTVTVDGSECDGVRIELNSALLVQEQTLDGPTSYPFVLPEDIAAGAALILSRDGEWWDLRTFSGAIANSQDPSIVWSNPAQELDALIYGGEGRHLELKQELPDSTRESKRTVLKTVVAFANDAGGTVLFGIDNNHHPVGLDETRETEDEIKQRLTNLVRSTIDPAPPFDIKSYRPDGRLVLALEVVSSGKVHALFPATPEFYVRRSGSTFRATRDEVITLIAARTQHEGARHPFTFG